MRKTATALLGFRRISALCAVLLAVMWVPVTSHELLESIDWIHHEADADHPVAAHESADGHYRVHTSKVEVKVPALLVIGQFVVPAATAAVGVLCRVEVPLTVSRDTEAPPGLAQNWNFALRLALPARAP